MPLKAEQLAARVNTGKPFIVGQFLGMDISEMLCRTKADPSKKENRVLRRFTIKNRNGIHVYTEYLQPGARADKNAAGEYVKVFNEKGEEVISNLKPGAEVVVTLAVYERDGVGLKIMGEVETIA